MSEAIKIDALTLENVADAPTIVFDEVPMYGVMLGMGRITLATLIQDHDGKGGITDRLVAVVHLRGNEIALRALRDTLNKMELLATGPIHPEGPPN